MNYLILIDEFLSLRKRQCKASRVETNLGMNVIKLSLLLMAVSTLSHAYQKAFEPTAANTIEIKDGHNFNLISKNFKISKKKISQPYL